MIQWNIKCIALGFMALACSIEAASPEPEKIVRDKIKTIFPGIEIDSLQKTPITGLYELMVDDEIVYVSEEGRYLIRGDLLDLDQHKRNLTEVKKGQKRLRLVNQVDESTMIVFRPKETKKIITVFTDIDCGYCRKFHEGVPALNQAGVAVRYMAFPRAGEGSLTYQTMARIWCSKNPRAAITKAKQGYPITDAFCQNHPIDKHLAIVRALGLTGTPVIIFEDGTLLPGYLPPGQLLKRLEGTQ